jgi:hypothetical protein
VKLLLLSLVCAQAFASSNDWPVYRHDVALSGVSAGKGNITVPEVKWEYYLGAPFVPIAMAGTPPAENVADLDGDGTKPNFSSPEKAEPAGSKTSCAPLLLIGGAGSAVNGNFRALVID